VPAACFQKQGNVPSVPGFSPQAGRAFPYGSTICLAGYHPAPETVDMESSPFLLTEYEACFEQLRYYDTRQDDVLKYLFTLSSAVATAQFAIFKLFGAPTEWFFAAQSFLSLIVFVASVLLYLMMLQNRLYFVFTARQINAIRKFMLETEAATFTQNQLYTSTSFSAFKLRSVHTFQLLGAAFISSLFGAASAYGFLQLVHCSCIAVVASAVLAIVGFAEVVGGAFYLKRSSEKSADVAVHGA
jgi:hypothetical protein